MPPLTPLALQRHLIALTPLPADADAAPSGPSPSTIHPGVLAAARRVLAGDLEAALAGGACRAVLRRAGGAGWAELEDLVGGRGGGAVGAGIGGEDMEDGTPEWSDEDAALARLVTAVALLHAYVQVNYTGPDLALSPSRLLGLGSGSREQADPDPHPEGPPAADADADAALNATAIRLLARGGEPAYHLARAPAVLLLAIRLLEALDRPGPGLAARASTASAPWWRLRAENVHMALLDEAVPRTDDLVQRVERLPEAWPGLFYPEIEADTTAAGPSDALAALHLELGLLHHALSSERAATAEFRAAAAVSGLEFALSGALGRRTRYQTKDVGLLVLLARSRGRGEADERADARPESAGGEHTAATPDNVNAVTGLPEALPLNDDTLLENAAFATVATDSSATGTEDPTTAHLPPALRALDPAHQPPLDPLDQSLLLSFCLNEHATSSAGDNLSTAEMTAYVARVLEHPRNWSVHTTALLLRARLEAGRSRTVQRSALQLQALVDQMPTADSAPAERLRYVHQLPLPSKWEMEQELARRYLSLGVVKSALEIFTRLEMWEEAVKCLVSMERTDRAVEVVKDLLEGKKVEMDIVTLRYKVDARAEDGAGAGADAASTKRQRQRQRIDSTREAKLWCLLGDLEPANAEAHYTHAWSVSGGTSSRSQRSLGALYVTQQKQAQAIECFRAALKINPLFARTWFALGCCLVKEERWEEARDAFSRNTAIEEEDGEAWNNLAAVYLRITVKNGEEVEGEKEDRPHGTVPFANKRLAFLALQQGLRFSRENWRMWQNYMVVAIDVGEMSEAARALSTLVEQRSGKNAAAVVDYAVLSKLVDAVTRESWNGGKGDEEKQGSVTSNEGLGLLPIVDRLFDVVILPRVSDSPRVFAIQARLFRWKEDWASALECYLKAYRSGVANDERVERDRARFVEAVEDFEELVNLMQNLGPRAKEQEEKQGLVKGKAKWGDWKFQARTLVRTFTGRVKDSFGDEPEFEKLKELMEEIRNA